ncbi:uncharacterized protein LOC132902819 [Amyelois transitella]|uniref:uncharacterized protein LOC132902819 n=1 Tax=Amyelois transitella TaxID=680683 RepID=UPI00298FFF81|nr:uncharacterized protein LOC132902819 [Amyelois transitella]
MSNSYAVLLLGVVHTYIHKITPLSRRGRQRQHLSEPKFLTFRRYDPSYDPLLLQRIIYNPHNGYEPYWKDGEWHIRNPGDWDFSNITTTRPPTVCGDECPYLFTRIKHVCAKQSKQISHDSCSKTGVHYCGEHENIWYPQMRYAYKTFPTYCSFLNAECSAKQNYGSQYNLMYVGECAWDFKDLFKPMSKSRYPLERLQGYLKDLIDERNMTIQYVSQTFPTTAQRKRAHG